MSGIVGWSVVLEGQPADLHDCASIFDEESGPRVLLDDRNRYILRAPELDLLESFDEVFRAAEGLLARMNGARLLCHSGGPVRLGDSLIWNDADGRSRVIAVEMGTGRYALRGGIAKFHGSAGPQAHPALAAMRASDQHRDISDALVFWGRADNWFDLYKTYETIRDSVPGHRLAKCGLLPSRPTESRLTGTMDYHRHARSSFVGQQMSFAEAKALVKGAIERWIAGRSS